MRSESPAWLSRALGDQGYLADEELATIAHVALELGSPLLLEGRPGVGKTEVANALAATFGAQLVRLQCHEGLDVHQALYDWDYTRQLLGVRAAEATGDAPDIYSREYLLARPLLHALELAADGAEVLLLIDEIDRADDAFDAFLLELLSDFAVSIPELGRIAATTPPAVVLTSNRTRELHDALKRRCFYHWIDYPDLAREAEIVRRRVPGVPELVVSRVCDAVRRLRAESLYKPPGAGEAVAWARALLALGPEADLEGTLGIVLKTREDIEQVVGSGVLRDA